MLGKLCEKIALLKIYEQTLQPRFHTQSLNQRSEFEETYDAIFEILALPFHWVVSFYPNFDKNYGVSRRSMLNRNTMTCI
jgi:hypothetical protein